MQITLNHTISFLKQVCSSILVEHFFEAILGHKQIPTEHELRDVSGGVADPLAYNKVKNLTEYLEQIVATLRAVLNNWERSQET